MDLGDLLVALLGGTVIGFLGKGATAAGHRDVPLWLTILCGVGGVVAGTYLYGQVFSPTTPGIDWWRHAWQVVAAAVLVLVAAVLGGRHRA